MKNVSHRLDLNSVTSDTWNKTGGIPALQMEPRAAEKQRAALQCCGMTRIICRFKAGKLC